MTEKSCEEVDFEVDVKQKQRESSAGAKDAAVPETPLPSFSQTQQPQSHPNSTEQVRSVVVVTDCCGNQFSVRDPRDKSRRPVPRTCDDGELQAVLTRARQDGSKVLIYVNGGRVTDARPFAEVVKETCNDLYAVTSQKSKFQACFDGRRRQAIAELLLDHYGEDLVSAFREFVRYFNDFKMENAAGAFVSGGAEAVIANWPKTAETHQQQPSHQQPSQHVPQKQETSNEELERIGREQMAEALANPIRTWQPSGQAA